MRVRSFVVGTILLGLMLAIASQEPPIFTDSEGLYTFTPPRNWVRIPQKETEEHLASIDKSLLATLKELRMVFFQPAAATLWSGGPSVELSVSAKGEVPLTDLLSYIDSGEFLKYVEKGARESEPKGQQPPRAIAYDKPIIDKATHTIWIIQKSNDNKGGAVIAILAMKLTCQGSVTAAYVATHSDAVLAFKEAQFLSTAIVISKSCQYNWAQYDNAKK